MEEQPEEKKPTAIEFAKQKLGINPDATFAEIKAQAHCEGILIYPVVYGRAKALLGLVPTAPYGSKSKAKIKARKEAASSARAAEARKSAEASVTLPSVSPSNGESEPGSRTTRAKDAGARAATDSFASLEGMITSLKNAVRERDSYRATLQKIVDLIQADLAD